MKINLLEQEFKIECKREQERLEGTQLLECITQITQNISDSISDSMTINSSNIPSNIHSSSNIPVRRVFTKTVPVRNFIFNDNGTVSTMTKYQYLCVTEFNN